MEISSEKDDKSGRKGEKSTKTRQHDSIHSNNSYLMGEERRLKAYTNRICEIGQANNEQC